MYAAVKRPDVQNVVASLEPCPHLYLSQRADERQDPQNFTLGQICTDAALEGIHHAEKHAMPKERDCAMRVRISHYVQPRRETCLCVRRGVPGTTKIKFFSDRQTETRKPTVTTVSHISALNTFPLQLAGDFGMVPFLQ